MNFNADVFYGHLIQGQLNPALCYLRQFPDQIDRLNRYEHLFEKQQLVTFPLCEELKAFMNAYQLYYRDVFYQETPPDLAADALRIRLAALISTTEAASLNDIEESAIKPMFERHDLHCLCGKTGGFHGLIIWKSTVETIYPVELPSGIHPYPVRFHSGFITKGWLDYLSFGEVSTGGWTDGDGVICCISDCYDTASEAFQVSLLKHEAQHAQDLSHHPGLSQESLEYRAKLVELIYSEQRNLLPAFAEQAGHANGHALAALRIAEEFRGIHDPAQIREKALLLLQASDAALNLYPTCDIMGLPKPLREAFS